MHLVCFIIRIYHDSGSSECQIRTVIGGDIFVLRLCSNNSFTKVQNGFAGI